MAHRALALLVVALLAACTDSTPSGNGGTFQVRATLMSNSCGPQSVPVASLAMFNAQVTVYQSTANWTVEPNGAMAMGAYADMLRAFRFEADNYFQLRAANQVTGQAACVMRRYDVIDGTFAGALPPIGDGGMTDAATFDAALDATSMLVDASDGPATFTATETILYGPVAGADCSDQIGAGDGQFSTLPCEIVYQMDALMTGPATTF